MSIIIYLIISIITYNKLLKLLNNYNNLLIIDPSYPYNRINYDF